MFVDKEYSVLGNAIAGRVPAMAWWGTCCFRRDNGACGCEGQNEAWKNSPVERVLAEFSEAVTLTATCDLKRDYLLMLRATDYKLVKKDHRGNLSCSVDCRVRNTSLTTTRHIHLLKRFCERLRFLSGYKLLVSLCA